MLTIIHYIKSFLIEHPLRSILGLIVCYTFFQSVVDDHRVKRLEEAVFDKKHKFDQGDV